jgi:Trypsin-co-occurring domain 2
MRRPELSGNSLVFESLPRCGLESVRVLLGASGKLELVAEDLGGRDGAEGFVGLASALEVLRSELETAWKAGEGRHVRFHASELTVTLQTVARREREGGGKLRWYVIEAGGGAKAAAEATQTLELTLTPVLYDEHGKAVGPLDVHGQQSEPGS